LAAHTGWTQLRSGRLFYPLAERPNWEDVSDEDIGHGISRQYRFGGHLADYTVAEHCVLLFHNVPDHLKLVALYHDAIEGLGFPDVQLPFKRSPQLVGFRELDHRLTREFIEFLRIPLNELDELENYDKMIAVSEAKRFFEDGTAKPHELWTRWIAENPSIDPLKSKVLYLSPNAAKSRWLTTVGEWKRKVRYNG
jgi:hypothetical protein